MANGALFLVRHGQTPLNTSQDERLRGWLDVPLATAGIVAARRAARAIQPHAPTILVSSDLTRALQTAQIMSVTLALSPKPTRDLRPWNVGRFAGEPVSLVGAALDQYMTTRASEATPGGESFKDFMNRWRAEFFQLLKRAVRDGTKIVAVTHARNLYALNKILYGEDVPVKGPPHPGSVVVVTDGDPINMRTLVRGVVDGAAS